MDGWEILSNGGDGFKAEDDASGCKPLAEANPDADGKAIK